jgi:tetratricopeptide (TPR) repeat protein
MHQYQPEGLFDWQLAQKARSMEKSQVRILRETLSNDPNNLTARRLLFEKYNRNHIKSILPHLIWFIDNQPKNAVLQIFVWANFDEVYKEARKHWIAQIRSNPNDVTILCHAAQFVEMNEPLLAAKFLQKASETDILDEELPRRLSHIFKVKAIACPSRAKYYVRKAIEQMKIALERYAVRSEDHSYLQTYFNMELSGLADIALEVNFLKEASDLAQILLRHGKINEIRLSTKSDPTSPTIQRSTHSGHAILTVVALRTKNVDEAKSHLSIMKSLINQQLPNDAIVQGLLKLGELELAMEYLGHIHKYWKTVVEGRCDDYRAGTNKEYPKQMEKYLRTMSNRIRKEFKAS